MFKYLAFISFRTSDSRWALWLQRRLERYRLPVSVRRRTGLSRKLGRCFCYLRDMRQTHDLIGEFKAHMGDSKYLVVICSPQVVHSKTVNEGIRYFASLGHPERIIPFIVEGVPYSPAPEQECLPEALRELFPADAFSGAQPLAVNLNEAGLNGKRHRRERALVMVIARMLDLDFNELWRREIRRRRQLVAMLIMMIVAVCTAIGMTWQMSRSFDCDYTIEELAPNTCLPQVDSAVVSLYLDGETKTDTLSGSQAQFVHLPASARTGLTRVTYARTNYLPLDTLVDLSQPVTLRVQRDQAAYGHVSAVVYLHGTPLRHADIVVGDTPCRTDSEGRFVVDIPLPDQRPAYALHVGSAVDTLYMPCGKDDVIWMD